MYSKTHLRWLLNLFLLFVTFTFHSNYCFAQHINQGFVENKGQIIDQKGRANSDVKYLLCKPGVNLQLKQNGFSYDTYTFDTSGASSNNKNDRACCHKGIMPPTSISRIYHRIDVELIGCNPKSQLIPNDTVQGYFNFFTAGAPQTGVSNVHNYNKVIYKNIYPGIDIEFIAYAKQNKMNTSIPDMEYNFIVHPGGNISDIKLSYKGGDKITLNQDKLNIIIDKRELSENIQNCYLKESKEKVNLIYHSIGNNVFAFSTNRKSTFNDDLIIDPIPCLLWGTYYGESGGTNIEYGISLDADNDIYITGATPNTAYIATNGAFQTTYGGGAYDAFIAKFDSNGTHLVWGTYFGGSDEDIAYSIATDSGKNVCISGYTFSSNLATAGAYQTSFGDIFIAKFNAAGSNLLWCTYFGGIGVANGITFDSDDNVYITGETSSPSGIATAGAYQTSNGGGAYDSFIAKFNSTGSNLVWGTYYGGSGNNECWALVLDKANNVYVTGHTSSSSGIATGGAYQTNLDGSEDAFVAKFNSSGTNLIWGTYYGGNEGESGNAIALDSSENVYISGQTNSTTGISTPGSSQPIYGGGSYDGFAAKFNSAGTVLVWGSYYGGTGQDGCYGIAVDRNNEAYITGYTDSSFTNIATPGAYDTILSGYDGFVAKFNETGSALLWGTYYGTGVYNVTLPKAIALDEDDNVYIAGYGTSDSGVATPGSYQSYTGAGWAEFFVAEFGCNAINGVSEINSSKSEVSVYPNPTHGVFNINIKNFNRKCELEIYNVLGEKIYSQFNINNSSLTIDLSSNPSGVYLLRVFNEKEIPVAQGKVVVAK